ncbi:hypothetical protein ACFV30_33715 [Streptomyces sp. NPDC059752]
MSTSGMGGESTGEESGREPARPRGYLAAGDHWFNDDADDQDGPNSRIHT